MANARPATDESAAQPAGNGRGTTSPFGDKAYTGSKKGHKKAPQLLRDMRRVYDSDDESQDRTPGMRHCRKLLKEKAELFLARLQAMEKEQKAASLKAVEAVKAEEGTAEVPTEADEGTVAVLGLIDRLLEQGKEPSVRDGRCTTCGQPVPAK